MMDDDGDDDHHHIGGGVNTDNGDKDKVKHVGFVWVSMVIMALATIFSLKVKI